MKKKYRILPVEGLDGIEFLADNPVGRRIYGPGEIIELDDTIHAVARIMARGQIEEIIEAPPEVIKLKAPVADKEE